MNNNLFMKFVKYFQIRKKYFLLPIVVMLFLVSFALVSALSSVNINTSELISGNYLDNVSYSIVNGFDYMDSLTFSATTSDTGNWYLSNESKTLTKVKIKGTATTCDYYEGTINSVTSGVLDTCSVDDNFCVLDHVIPANTYFGVTCHASGSSYQRNQDSTGILPWSSSVGGGIVITGWFGGTAVPPQITGSSFFMNIAGLYFVENISPLPYNFSAGNYDITASKEGYYDITENFTFDGSSNYNETFIGLYNYYINASAFNGFSNLSLNNISGWIYNANYSYNNTFSNPSNYSLIPVINGYYQVYLEVYGYSVSELNYNLETVNNENVNSSFYLFSENSIFVTVYDEETGIKITDNLTIIVSGNVTEETYYTTNSTLFVDNLTDGDYTVKISSDNYTIRNYDVTVSDRSFQYLNVYLSSSTSEVIFTIVDSLTINPLNSVSVIISSLIDGSWVIISSKNTDITGKVEFNYVTNNRYRISVSKTDYADKVFYLDPILYPTYTVKLIKTSTVDNSPSFQGVNVFYDPSVFYANQTNNLTFTFSSPDGLFTSYNLSVVYPSSSFFESGVLATGEIFFNSFNVSDVTYTSSVNITYCYDTSIASYKCFSIKYGLVGYSATGSFLDNKDNTYGMGVWKRVLLATLVFIIVAGLVTVIAGILLGSLTGLFLMGYLVAIGFIPLWVILPSILVGFFLLMGRSS